MFCFPLATELGIFLVYFLDFVVGSCWLPSLLYAALAFAVCWVRGPPYAPANIVEALMPKARKALAVPRAAVEFWWAYFMPAVLTVGAIAFLCVRRLVKAA